MKIRNTTPLTSEQRHANLEGWDLMSIIQVANRVDKLHGKAREGEGPWKGMYQGLLIEQYPGFPDGQGMILTRSAFIYLTEMDALESMEYLVQACVEELAIRQAETAARRIDEEDED